MSKPRPQGGPEAIRESTPRGAREAEPISLEISFVFNPASGLFDAALPNGARFAFALNNVSGKLGANLALLRDYTLLEAGKSAPRPKGHASVSERYFGAARDAQLVAEAIAAGKLQKVGVVKAPKRSGPITLEELGL